MRQLLIWTVLGLQVFLFSCSGLNTKSATNSDDSASRAKAFELDRKLPSRLSHKEALARSRRVSHVKYNLFFDLGTESEYSGKATIEFDLSNAGQDLRLDFHEGSIKQLTVQGQKVEAPYNQRYLLIPASALKKGKNNVTVEFSRTYARDGSGLMWFQDQEDGRVYTYTDLEPYDANRVFPCFDQPDLKATYTMRVHAPAEWQVVTSVREENIKNLDNGDKEWSFPESAKFSTYIWSLHAGPYKVWEDKFFEVPLRLFVRQSLARYVDPQEWFTVTRQGFDFFNSYFDSPYPFKKYDQLIVPEFNAGAMENVAAVTFSERYVSRGEKSRSEERAQASVILHEMAHMWFGNLVTMKWWNDLWLNESFATYMANLALAEGTEFKEAWQSFHGTKSWAYWEDQNVTTHPIETEVPTTLEAFANFDGITYGKGASALKQLAFFLGPQEFQKGVQIYFKRHAWTNTELKDFMSALEKGANQDLGVWQRAWLQTAGLNTVTARFECNGKKLTSLQLTQDVASGADKLRSHRMEVALIDNNKAFEKFTVLLKGNTTSVDKAVGKACPSIVLPNSEDHAYVRVSLDPISLKNLKGRISKLDDPLTKRLIWTSLWEDFRDAKISLSQFASMALAEVGQEQNPLVLRQLLEALHGRRVDSPSVLYYWPKKSAKEKKAYTEFVSELEGKIWNALVAAGAKSERQKILLDSFVLTTETPKAQSSLLDLLSGKAKLKGLVVDQDRRWEVIVQLSRLGHPQAPKLIAGEEKKDPSTRGQLAAITARAAQPDWSVKQQWLERFRKGDQTLSFMEQKQAIWGLFPRHQSELHQRYGNRFFEDLKLYNTNKDPSFVSAFAGLVPQHCGTEVPSGTGIKEFINENKGQLVAPALKSLRIAAQEEDRCDKIRRLVR